MLTPNQINDIGEKKNHIMHYFEALENQGKRYLKVSKDHENLSCNLLFC